MSGFGRILATLAVCWSLASCGVAPPVEDVGKAAQPITTVCYTNINGVTGVLPASATYPIGSQHVFCEHQVTAFTSPNWAPATFACTPGTPGQYQVDIWVKDFSTPNPNYYCARIYTPADKTDLHLNFRDILDRGWLGSYPDAAHHRVVYGTNQGPTTVMVASSLQDAWTTGCDGVPAHCQSRVVRSSNPVLWTELDNIMTVNSLWVSRNADP